MANYHISSNKHLGAYLKFCLEGGEVGEEHFSTVKGAAFIKKLLSCTDPTEVKTYKVLNKVAVEAGFFLVSLLLRKWGRKGGASIWPLGVGAYQAKGPC